MADLRTERFVGADKDDATAQLYTAIMDGSFPVVSMGGLPTPMWITHAEVVPGAMQQPYYELHVTAWVIGNNDPVQAVIEAIHEGRR